ncbi:RNA-binding protein 34 [Anoplophora glabripennis]|uniref:RNA-binding protein 34 n=1 Tax=Anoplophora glabripennis TaxID=217634 RepID=UPI0008757DEB|nr:RNA-binding protein 34 [Anoplophora glabripennis]
MDYSVGSLADLISGSNTPNKPRVIKKAVKKNNQVSKIQESTNLDKTTTKKFKKGNTRPKQKFSKPIQNKLTESPDSTNNKLTEGKKRVKNRKRKLQLDASDSTNEAFPLKKQKVNKNEQNAERRVKNKIKGENKVQDPAELERTIFVGNVPITCEKKKIKNHFKKYGKIETIRIRGIPVADLKTSKKVAAIKKEFNPNRSNVYCFIRFADKESALKAEAENGSLFEEHHLRVHSCTTEEKPDETKAIFVGNLSFNAIEDDLWKLFESCGPISYVRIVRDHYTGMGKGFGYVNFLDSDAVQLALEMENVKLNDRELRISLCNLNSARKNKKKKNNKKATQPGEKKLKNKTNRRSDKVANEPENKVKQINAEFQGAKFSDKKKRKVNKGLLEKKKLVKKIAPKPK